MTGWDRRDEFSLPEAGGRSTLVRYGFAVAASLTAVLVSAALTQDAEPLYALLVAVVAVTVWYGGLGPGLVAIAVGWASKFVIVVLPGDFHGAEVTRWLAALATALGVVWVSFVLRSGRERAEASIGELGALGQLSAGLSRATTSAEVAHVVTHEASALLGAQGAALGLVEGEEVVVVDPIGLAARTHLPGGRLTLDRSTLITRAAREGTLERADNRAELETSYADSAALLTPATQGAIAAPLRAGGQLIGSIGFVFDGENAVNDEVEALTVIVAELAGQALERTRLYERERDAHAALDRILRVAPRFHADSPEDVAEAICREARLTFGADFGVLWRVNGTRLELVRSDPAHAALPLGLAIPLDDFPELEDAVGAIRPSFVSDIQDEAAGAGLSRVRTLGIRSSLRAPIAVGGEARLVLIVSWQTVISDPDPSTVVIMRRLADQAGLAIEQAERRRAQDDAFRRGEESRRLQAVTAALSLSATPTDVSNTCLEHALAAVGADAGFVVLTGSSAADLAASNGYESAELEAWWGGLSLDASLPFSRAIADGEPVWALGAETASEFVAGPDAEERGWLALPLRTRAGVHGAVQLAFRTPKDLSDEDRSWLQNVASQCAQALERSRLFDEEQRLRIRSERLQGMTAALSTALTRADVATVVVHEIGEAVDAAGVAFAILREDRDILNTLASQGYSEASVDWLEAPFDAPTPANRALRRRVSAFFESIEAIREEFPAIAGDAAATGHESFLFVPLVGGRRANGLVVLSWAERYELSGDERRFVESLVGQAAQALDRAIHFESERTIAETLQRSVLPVSLPRVDGVELAARYLPGTAELEVGGDWFDAMQLPDGKLGLVVGDVVGKGVRAAASMAQLRNALRAYSLDRMKPSSTVARLNRLADEVLDTSFATLVYVVVDPQAGVCRFTAAGHPPPLVVYADGRAEFLEGARGLPLGAGANTSYKQDTLEVPAGSVLLLYTDGLVERRERPIDEGLELLRAAAADGPRDPEQLLERILQRLVGTEESADDIALLAIRFLPVAPQPLRLRVPSEAGSLELVRDVLRAWFETVPLDRSDVEELVLASWEACANAIEHAREPSGDHVTVWADLSKSHVTISIHDTGSWSPPTERPDRGLGLRLVRSAASTVDIDADEKGTKVTFEKQLRD
ncbi:MAG: SpoIIE family protein phosphatase [Gaiellaceae bacterium]